MLDEIIYYILKNGIFEQFRIRWGCNSVVECPLRMRKAPGSNPGISNNFPFFPEGIIFSLFFFISIVYPIYKIIIIFENKK